MTKNLHKDMIKEIINHVKKNEICFYQKTEGGKIDKTQIEPCEFVLIIAFLKKK